MKQGALFPNDSPEMDSFVIALDKRWKLDELNEYTKNFEQAYYAAFALEALKAESVLPHQSRERVHKEMASYPWRGGYSTLNFYFGIKSIVGRRRQPSVASIKYASPGWMELSLYQEVALNISLIVSSLCGSVALVNKTYNGIYKGLRDRQLNEISVERARLKLDKEKMEFLKSSVHEMATVLHIEDASSLTSIAGNDLRALKILLSVYRRVRILAEYQEKGKATLPLADKRKRK